MSYTTAELRDYNRSDLDAMLDWAADEIERLQKTIDGLSSDMPPTVHWRKCHDCGTVQLHADSRTPYVLCRKCGSQDTRRVTQ